MLIVLLLLALAEAFRTPFRNSPRPLFIPLYLAKKAPPVNEFSRVLSAAQVTERRPVLCKIIAKESERDGLAERFDVFKIEYLAANVTVTRTDAASLLVEGVLAARVRDGLELEPFAVDVEFDTLILDNAGAGELSFEEATEYDDEIGEGGVLDIGEIAAQYLGMEL